MLFDMTQDTETKVRTIKLADGQEIYFKRNDPYGLISITFLRGSPPKELSGQYTSFFEAERSVEIYLNTIKNAKKAVAA